MKSTIRTKGATVLRVTVLAMLAIAATTTVAAAQSWSAHMDGAGFVQPQFSVIYNFGSQLGDPIQPFYSGILAQGRDGNLYSGSSAGGKLGGGATYKITPGGALTTLASFGGTTPSSPLGGLTLGTDGNFYGTAYGGGFGTDPYRTVFKMTPEGVVSPPSTSLRTVMTELCRPPRPFKARMETSTEQHAPGVIPREGTDRFTRSRPRASSRCCTSAI